MFRTIDKDVTAGAGLEVVVEAIAGVSGKHRRIVSVQQEKVASVILRCYVDQDRIVDVASEIEALSDVPIPVDYPLAEGQSFRVGFLNQTGGGITQHIMIVVEET